jgi:hypothetical protein
MPCHSRSLPLRTVQCAIRPAIGLDRRSSLASHLVDVSAARSARLRRAAALKLAVPRLAILAHKALEHDHEQAHRGHERKADDADLVGTAHVGELLCDDARNEVMERVCSKDLEDREDGEEGGAAALDERRSRKVRGAEEHR